MPNEIMIPDPIQAQRVDQFKLEAKALEDTVLSITKLLREIFDQENIASINFLIQAEGRVRGDLKITYKLTDANYDGNSVKGAQLVPILEEFFRRRGWQSKNDPKELPYN